MGRMNRDRPASRRRADEVFAARPQRREERERYRLHLGRTPPLNGPRRQPSSRSSDPPSPPRQLDASVSTSEAGASFSFRRGAQGIDPCADGFFRAASGLTRWVHRYPVARAVFACSGRAALAVTDPKPIDQRRRWRARGARSPTTGRRVGAFSFSRRGGSRWAPQPRQRALPAPLEHNGPRLGSCRRRKAIAPPVPTAIRAIVSRRLRLCVRPTAGG